MKKIIFIITLIISLTFITVYASNKTFGFSIDTVSENLNTKTNYILKEFNKEYKIEIKENNIQKELEKEIILLSKKTTSLLLGEVNNTSETSENYYKRHQDFLNLRYNPNIPKDDSTYTGYDEKSQEYKDDIISGTSLPSVFNKLNELNVIYSSYGDIKVFESNNFIGSKVFLPDVKMKVEKEDNPLEYEYQNTSLTLYYFYKKLNDEYKLYYLYGETREDTNTYLNQIEQLELTKTKSIIKSTNLNSIYDYSKASNLKDETLNKIYDNNKDNLIYLRAFYNNTIETEANGFIINDGLVITTWSFLNKALETSQYITLSGDSKEYEIDGIVTINPEFDIAILKLTDKTKSSIKLSKDDIKEEDPLISLSSQSGVNISIQTGIVLSNKNNIETSISLKETAIGSPLFNENGEVVGIIKESGMTSLGNNLNVLREIANKFQNYDFSTIKTISFQELKEKYYY